MANRTTTQLARNVLLHLGVVAAEDQPSAADLQFVTDRYTDIHAELTGDGMAYWPVSAIPANVFEPLTQLVALSVSGPFGKMVAPRALEDGMDIFKRRLRRRTHTRPAELPVEFEDF